MMTGMLDDGRVDDRLSEQGQICSISNRFLTPDSFYVASKSPKQIVATAQGGFEMSEKRSCRRIEVLIRRDNRPGHPTTNPGLFPRGMTMVRIGQKSGITGQCGLRRIGPRSERSDLRTVERE